MRPLEIGDPWILLIPSLSEKGKQVAPRAVDHWRMGPIRAKSTFKIRGARSGTSREQNIYFVSVLYLSDYFGPTF